MSTIDPDAPQANPETTNATPPRPPVSRRRWITPTLGAIAALAIGLLGGILIGQSTASPARAFGARAAQGSFAGGTASANFTSGTVVSVKDGTLVVNGDDPGVQRVIDRFRSMPARVLTYGAGSGNDWRFDGRAVTGPSGAEIKLDLAVPGVHNRSNATAALVVMREMGIELPEAASALSSYRGVGRRFELKGEADGVTVIDDYAHHPQEIAATIAAARERYPGRRIVAAFQPHTYSRTRALLDPFAQALGAADRAIVLDIYPARETETLGVSSEDIVRRMNPERTVAGGTLAQAVDRLFRETRTGDVVLTLGAGDVTLVGPKLLALLEDRS